ncbi:MAG TPA: hypothetical protein PKY59_18590 [Pyrinomonadaceae bacterium]|nr:hypothetical protein [Pyrinomonadaceae bacterium]
MKLKFALALITIILFGTINAIAFSQTDITGPSGSGGFGIKVTALPNGNIVIVDTTYDAPGPVTDVGAVYLFNGKTGVLISTLTGSRTNDLIGSFGITVLANGNFVVLSDNWDSGSTANVGAVTWCSAEMGCAGQVSAANSMIGTTAEDRVGNSVKPLTNGNYVISSPFWDNGAIANSGAVTWANGLGGTVGAVNAANSLIGGSVNDVIGTTITALPNGNYIVQSGQWDNGASVDAGAVTFGNGLGGTIGLVSAANSLVGSASNDTVGEVYLLTNGNYVVGSQFWDNGAVADVGAATFCSGTAGCSGAVSAANSLVGSANSDQVGEFAAALANGNYVVSSPHWDNGAAFNAGAATWCNGAIGCSGAIDSTNSLVGGSAGDLAGSSSGIFPLTNGNYVVKTIGLDLPGIVNAGAVTLGNGTTGTTGVISAANSLVGSSQDDFVGGSNSFVTIAALTNGNYVVHSPEWNNGAQTDVGAVTWCNGMTGCIGAVSSSNSITGLLTSDKIGSLGSTVLPNGNYVIKSPNFNNGIGAATWRDGGGTTTGVVSFANSLIGAAVGDSVGLDVVALPNGNYVARSPFWNNGAITDAGAVTFGFGSSGVTGFISSANSLVGTALSERAGNSGITVLSNGNYLVANNLWDNGAAIDAGSVTWCSGTNGCIGNVSAANSLIGTKTNDNVGNLGTVTALANGNYVVNSPNWDNGATVNSGAITYGAGNNGTVGVIFAGNSILGGIASGGPAMVFSFNSTTETLIAGRKSENAVSIFNPTYNAIGNGNWSAAAVWDFGAFNKSHDVVIPNGRNLNLDVTATVNSLTIDCTGNLNGGGNSSYIIGKTAKNFCSPSSFTYPIGTANGYSPVDANVSNVVIIPSSLAIEPTQSIHPSLDQTNSLKRFWSLKESGDLTTDLTFHYLDPTDISTAETNYKLFRIDGLGPTPVPFALDTTANTISAVNISNFSDWAVGNTITTSTDAFLSGKVTDAMGNGIRNVKVTLTNQYGNMQIQTTNSFGEYKFEHLILGNVYIVSVNGKKLRFENPSRVITVNENVGEIDFKLIE